MLRKTTFAMTFLALIALLAIPLMAAAAPNIGSFVCGTQDGWTKVDDTNFHTVDGAISYCIKSGNVGTSDCQAYDQEGSFSELQDLLNGEHACGLSHWGYLLGEPEPSDTPTTPPPDETETVTATTPPPDETPDGTETVTATTPAPDETPQPSPTPKPRRHQETGPEDAASILGWVVLVGLGLTSAGIAGMRRR